MTDPTPPRSDDPAGPLSPSDSNAPSAPPVDVDTRGQLQGLAEIGRAHV